MKPLSGSEKGTFVAVLTTGVVALGVAASQTRAKEMMSFAACVCAIAMIPAMSVGALTGWIATRLGAAYPIPMRLAILAVVPCLLVGVLGTLFHGSAGLIVAACVPTLAAVSILERWTRPPPDPIAARVVR